jgi:hypothetical protein
MDQNRQFFQSSSHTSTRTESCKQDPEDQSYLLCTVHEKVNKVGPDGHRVIEDRSHSYRRPVKRNGNALGELEGGEEIFGGWAGFGGVGMVLEYMFPEMRGQFNFFNKRSEDVPKKTEAKRDDRIYDL